MLLLSAAPGWLPFSPLEAPPLVPSQLTLNFLQRPLPSVSCPSLRARVRAIHLLLDLEWQIGEGEHQQPASCLQLSAHAVPEGSPPDTRSLDELWTVQKTDRQGRRKRNTKVKCPMSEAICTPVAKPTFRCSSVASFSLQTLFLVGAALPSCSRIPSISRSSVSASASCVGSATSPNLRSSCLRRVFASPLCVLKIHPFVNVDRDGWLHIGQERGGCLIEGDGVQDLFAVRCSREPADKSATPKNTPQAKLHTRASPNPAEPLPYRRPPAPPACKPGSD